MNTPPHPHLIISLQFLGIELHYQRAFPALAVPWFQAIAKLFPEVSFQLILLLVVYEIVHILPFRPRSFKKIDANLMAEKSYHCFIYILKLNDEDEHFYNFIDYLNFFLYVFHNIYCEL